MQSNRPSYLDIQTLASGAYGKVHKVTIENIPFAVKVIENPDKLAIQELLILMLSNHPNIIRCFGHIPNNRSLIILMEFADQGALCTQTLRWPEEEVWKFIFQIANGLAYTHMGGIIHRDIKPGNILCVSGDNNQPLFKIADFGLSRFVNDVTKDNHYANTYAGTYCYMAPEVLNGLRYTSNADIWSFGAVISYVCNGSHLFESNDHVRQQNGMMDPLPSHYSLNLRGLVARMLNVNSEQRPNALEICVEADLQVRQLNGMIDPLPSHLVAAALMLNVNTEQLLNALKIYVEAKVRKIVLAALLDQ